MRIISPKTLKTFYKMHPDAEAPLQVWMKTVKPLLLTGFNDLRQVYPSVDRVGHYVVFNIGGNKYRLITAIHFNTGTLYIREVLTHAEYDKNQ